MVESLSKWLLCMWVKVRNFPLVQICSVFVPFLLGMDSMTDFDYECLLKTAFFGNGFMVYHWFVSCFMGQDSRMDLHVGCS